MYTAMTELIADLKTLLIRELNLEGVQPTDIDADAPLFGDGPLGLDSVDALEVAMEVERSYGVVIQDDEASRAILTSVRSLATHIQAVRA